MQNMIVSLGLLIVFAVVTLLLMREGLWSAMVMFLNVLLAASVATAWYEVLANWMETLIPSYTYLLDFLAIWSIFSVLVLVLREITDRVSRTKVKFLRQVELIGAPAMAMLTGWVMVAFTAASLHTAALPREFVQPKPQTRMLFGCGMDRVLGPLLKLKSVLSLIKMPTLFCGMQIDAKRWKVRKHCVYSNPETSAHPE